MGRRSLIAALLLIGAALHAQSSPATPQLFPIAIPGTIAHTVQYQIPSTEIENIGDIAVSHGWALTGATTTAGNVVNGPVTLSFTYGGGVLTIVIAARPFYISEAEIFGEIASWFYTPPAFGTNHRPICLALPCPAWKAPQ
jgi:hypothetical protein